MEEQNVTRWRRILYYSLLGAAAWAIQLFFNRTWPDVNVWLETVLVFSLMKTVGDGLQLAFLPAASLVFGEDFLRELVVFSGIGLVAGAAIDLALRLSGGPVPPVLPALGGYLAYGYSRRSW